jgi:hypothetical protein
MHEIIDELWATEPRWTVHQTRKGAQLLGETYILANIQFNNGRWLCDHVTHVVNNLNVDIAHPESLYLIESWMTDVKKAYRTHPPRKRKK